MIAALLVPAESPALPLHTAGPYVAAAYIVLFAMLLIYLSIMALRLTRMERNLGELLEQSDAAEAQKLAEPAAEQESAPV